MLHGSVVASTISVIDILGAGRVINGKFYVFREGLYSAAVIYLALVVLITQGFRIWEKHWHAHLRARPTSAPKRAPH